MRYSASAKWEVITTNSGEVQLRIRLWNDTSLTLLAPADAAPFVLLGQGERISELDKMNYAQIVWWLQRAQGRR